MAGSGGTAACPPGVGSLLSPPFPPLGELLSVLAWHFPGSLGLRPPSEFTAIVNYISHPEGICPDSSLRDLLIHPWLDYDPKC